MTEQPRAETLASFIRAHKQQILETWLDAASALPSAQGLPIPLIRDHVPELLDTLAEAIEREDATAVPMKGLPNLHAAIRVREGYDLRQVVAEYRALRRVIHALYSQRGDFPAGMRSKTTQLQTMHGALDAAISDAVDQFALDRDRAREIFIGMLGHDLRDPLQAIITSAGLLAGPRPEIAKIASRITVSAERMERLIADLLDFARGRFGGGLTIVAARLDARVMIANTVDEIAHAHPERNITTSAKTAPGDFHVTWDGDRVVQAISNLVSNAIAHGHDPIVIAPRDDGDEIVIEVHNGGEIARGVLPTLFAPFTAPDADRRHTVEAHSERRRGHLGLGLYIVSEIAKAHGGSVAAVSNHGETAVRLTLPRHAAQPALR